MTSLSSGGGVPFMLKRKQPWMRIVMVLTASFFARKRG